MSIAPAGKYRVVSWRRSGRLGGDIDSDLDTREDAIARADALLIELSPDCRDVRVFNQMGTCIYSAIDRAAPVDFHRYRPVTRVAGLDDPLKRRKGGNYSKR